MAVVTIGLPTFNGTENDDLDKFIALYRGHLNSININSLDLVANPSGSARATGILRGCMQGFAAEWFDRELTGKNWEVQYIHKNGVALLGAFQALVIPEGVGGPNANTYVNPSPAHTYAGIAGNALDTIGGAFIPTGLRFMDNDAWRRSGGRPTNTAPNPLRNDVAGNGGPIIFEGISPDQALYWMSEKFPTLLEAKRRLRFGNLYQDILPIREYFNEVDKSARLLNFPDQVRDDQFFRGLSPENSVEMERIGMEKPVRELVDILERVEKRKAEVHLGLTNRKAQEEYRLKRVDVEPVQKPPISQQEPVTFKPVASHAITQDMLNTLLQQHTENLTKNFQTQLQTLQEKVSQPAPVVQKVLPPAKPPLPFKTARDMQDLYESENPFHEYDREFSFDEIMGTSYSKPVIKIAQKVARKLAQAEERRQDRELTRAMQDLSIDEHYPEPMDTSNVVRIGDREVDTDDLNGYIANLIRSQKKR